MRVTISSILMCALLALHCQAEESYHTVLRGAREFVSQKRYLDAISHYRNAAEATADDRFQAIYLTSAAEIAIKNLGDTAAAAKLADLIHDPIQSRRLTLIVLYADKRYQDLIDATAGIDLSSWPLDCQLDAYYRRGLAHAALDHYQAAAQDLQHAADTIGDTSTRLNACLQLGQLYEDQLHDTDLALAAYTQATTITQAGYSSRNNCFIRRIAILLERGQADQALADFAAIDYNRLPSDIWRGTFYLLHAKVHQQLGNNGSAATLLTRVLRLSGTTNSQKEQAQAAINTIIAQMRDQPVPHTP